jgi:LCP family protein required for cell wall assembly
MNNSKRYLLLFSLIAAIAGGALFLFVPNLETESFNQEVISNIIDGVTTTTELPIEDITETTIVSDEIDPIPIEEANLLEVELVYNEYEKIINGFTTYLLIGSDERDSLTASTRGNVTGRRADVIILGLVKNTTKEVTLLSLPRDLLIVNSCTDNLERINATYTKNNCGEKAENLAAAIFNLTGLRIEHFASFNFTGFEEIIDAVGGIEACVDVTQREGYSFELQKGCQNINGLTALNWVVSRHTEVLDGEKLVDENGNDISNWIPMPGVSDLSRIKRQQYVVIQLIKKLKDFNSISDLYNFVKALENSFTIDENFSLNKSVEVLWTFRNTNLEKVKKLTVPVKNYTLNDGRQVLILQDSVYNYLLNSSVLDS